MFSGSVDVGFVPALPFHHGDLEPDCVGASTRGLIMHGIKISSQDFALKMQKGVYLRDTTVYISEEDHLRGVLEGNGCPEPL